MTVNHVERGPATMGGTELHRNSAMGSFGRWGHAMIEGKGRGRRPGSILLLTGDRKMMGRLLEREVLWRRGVLIVIQIP
jgi:hypothetical protein